jgi:hypothetical protein
MRPLNRVGLRCAGILLACASLLLPARAQDTVGELYASDASVKGAVVLAAGGTQVLSGSSVSAGDAAALLKLARGGEVRVCPRTSISVSTSAGGRDLQLGMGTGAVETHYSLAASADSLLTPDFRILLAGPATFHFAVGVDAHGDTCVRALPGNTASLIVSEMMGDGIYQVKPGEQLMFRGGHVAHPETLEAYDCGCPPPPPNLQRAAAPPPEPPAKPAATEPPPTPPQPPAGEVHVQVDAPFVFRAREPEPPSAEMMARVRLRAVPSLPVTVLPPPQQAPLAAPAQVSRTEPAEKPRKRGFFGKVRAFFASLFR